MKKVVIILMVIGLCLSAIFFVKRYSQDKNGKASESTSIKLTTESPKKNTAKPTGVTNNVKPFTSAEDQVVGIKLNMLKDEVEKILGEPLKVEKEYAGIYDADILKYYYKFGMVTLEPYDEEQYGVTDIEINQINYKGIRDIQVNDSVESVLQKFPYSKNVLNDKDGVKWVYGNTETKERGSIHYDKKGNIEYISYCYGKSESIGEYSLTYMVKNNRVTHIYLSVCVEI